LSKSIAIQDRVSQALSDALLGRPKRHSNNGWTNYCCPMCVLLGHSRPDRFFRFGIKFGIDEVRVYCFNCRFATGYRLGLPLRMRMRSLLEQLGVSERDVKLLAHWAARISHEVAIDPALQKDLQVLPQFDDIDMPQDAKSLQEWADLDCNDPDYIAAVEYLLSRGETAATATTYFWTPCEKLRHRLIIPCYQNHRIIGWIGRAVSSEIEPRYHRQSPSNFLFNVDLLRAPHRPYVFVVEGVFDALCIEGVSALGGTLTDQQIAWINQSEKQIVVVPDRDRAGLDLIEIAIAQGWWVATPCYGAHQWWDNDIKDAAAAVERYGKLVTLQSIIATKTQDPGKIRQRTSYLP
jgi:hypothetical protein